MWDGCSAPQPHKHGNLLTNTAARLRQLQGWQEAEESPGGQRGRGGGRPGAAPLPPGHRHPRATGFVTGTAGTPGCTLTAPGSRAGSAPGTWSFTKNATRKSKMKRKDRHPCILYWPSHGSAGLYSVFLEVTNSWHTGLSELSITTTHVTLKRIK